MIFGLDEGTKVVVQGITGHQGRIHGELMRSFGTNVVAGAVPGKGGDVVDGVPVFDSVAQAVRTTGAEASVIFVPASACLDAAVEAIESDIRVLVIVTEHLPKRDAVVLRGLAARRGARVIGPNCPGVCIPGKIKLGIMPNQIFSPGNVGVISRSGTLTYEIVQSLTDAGIGQNCCIGVGGDPVPGTTMLEAAAELKMKMTLDGIVLIGEIGGMAEIEAARLLNDGDPIPIVAFMAGRSAPPGKRMGHAGAIITKGMPGIQEKERILESLGVKICRHMGDVPRALKDIMS
jgi:succinyl-CoA synthetase alpha subunit